VSTILIVDDEPDLVRAVEHALRREGFATEVAYDGATALARCPALPALVLLDLMLPDMSGTEVCRRLRADERTSRIPVVMLTARGDEVDRVVGFEVGADDYVTKPFSMRVLVLLVRAVLRRTQVEVDGRRDGETLSVGPLRMDIGAHRVWVGKDEVVLTAMEFRLLRMLVERRGRVQTRETLLHEVWGLLPDLATRTIDTHIQRLRKKLGAAGDSIETLRGVGYRICAPEERRGSD
jgi:two-component system phosphate regulon response regulator PhoB